MTTRVVVHPTVLLGAAAGVALVTLGIAAWLSANADEFKLIHKRIDRLVKELVRLTKREARLEPPQYSTSSSPSSSPIPAWVVDLRGDVEFLKVRNKFLEDEIAALRNLVHSKQVNATDLPALVVPATHTPPDLFPPSAPLPPPLPVDLPIPPPISPPSLPPHLSHDAWLKAAEELVCCDESERDEKREEIEEAMGNMPSVVTLIRELFDKSTGVKDQTEKDALTQEYGNKLYDMFVHIYGDLAATSP